MVRVFERDDVDAIDVRAVLGAVLALHDAADLDALQVALPHLLADLIPFDSLDLIGELAAPDGTAGWSGRADHRLAIRTADGGHVLGGVVLGRRRGFTPRETAMAGLLGPQLGAAVDHVRLRAEHRSLGRGSPLLTALSGREREVLSHVADGRTNREIGDVLHIEARTVEKHVEHIRSKLGARSRAEAAARWARATA
ncbi:LuxR C-terminal-related transcriptional regulator [uncultured Amnibacterium sp.]|uniref:helix-turn-helix transcriptional regulator n=1 Tax=uncultured Amnibacterium sp. TaxID=1631851 RepID=UPI0035CC7EF0